MLGTIIGDIVGSRFEWSNIKSKEFNLFDKKCIPTDDSILSLSVAKAFILANNDYSNFDELVIDCMNSFARNYPYCGYGGGFKNWLFGDDKKPYNSFGNGSAMRISPVGYACKSIDEVKKISNIVSGITHNHPEGLKGAEAVAVAVFMANNKTSKEEIKKYIVDNYYDLDFTLDEIREDYTFDVSCQGSVPQALVAFFEGNDFEDVIRNAISIGGDSDTIAAIAGGIASAYYGIPNDIRTSALEYLDDDMKSILFEFENKFEVTK